MTLLEADSSSTLILRSGWCPVFGPGICEQDGRLTGTMMGGTLVRLGLFKILCFPDSTYTAPCFSNALTSTSNLTPSKQLNSLVFYSIALSAVFYSPLSDPVFGSLP